METLHCNRKNSQCDCTLAAWCFYTDQIKLEKNKQKSLKNTPK